MPLERQSSWDAGELAPTLWGRTGEGYFGKGARELTNFLVDHHGALVSRPGTKFVGECIATPAGAEPELFARRLIPFVVSDTDAMVLEFGHDAFRVYRPDGTLVATIQGHPYRALDLPQLRPVQIGKALYIVVANWNNEAQSYSARRLTRVADDGTSWLFEVVSHDAPAYDGARPALNTLTGNAADLPEYPSQEWVWYVTEVVRRSDGRLIESLPRQVVDKGALNAAGTRFVYQALTSNKHVLFPHLSFELFFGFLALPVPRVDQVAKDVVETRVYRGRGRLRAGFVGAAPGPQWKDSTVDQNIGGNVGDFNKRWNKYLVDYGDTPDYFSPPPAGRNPFRFTSGNTTRLEHPRCVAAFGARLIYGGTLQRPSTLFFSQEESLDNFDLPYRGFARPDSSFERMLLSRNLEEIRAMVGTDRLLVFTVNGVWSFELPLDPTQKIDGRLRSEIGSTWLAPLVLPNVVLYARAKGDGVRGLVFREDSGYAQEDVSFLAEHLFLQKEITAWCYQEDPWGMVWAVRDDGHLLACKHSIEHGQLAWSEMETGLAWGDKVLDVAVVPGTDEDVVFLIVQRGTKYLIERMATRRQLTSIADAVCLDSARTGTGRVVTGLAHLAGREVWALVDGNVAGPFTVPASGEVDVGIDGGVKVHVGLRFTCRLSMLDLASPPAKRKICKRVFVAVSDSRGMRAGGSEATLTDWMPREASDQWSSVPLQSKWVDLFIASEWGRGGNVVIEQVEPLPLTIYAVIRQHEEQNNAEV